MGHAGAVISGGEDTAEAKIAAMREAGITVVEGPHLLGRAMKELLERSGKPRKTTRDRRATDRRASDRRGAGGAARHAKPAKKP